METKDRILTQAQQLFAEQGIRAITMDDLANYLGISKRTKHIGDDQSRELRLISPGPFFQQLSPLQF